MKFKEFYLWERKKTKRYDFSSTQYDFPAELSKKIFEWGSKAIPDSVLDPEDGRQPLKDIHLTILYGLFTAESSDVEPLVKMFQAFEIELGEISLFKQETKDVVKIEVIPDPKLVMVHKFLKNNLKNGYKFDDYKPHVTIAYVQPNTCDHLIGDLLFSGIKLQVDCIQFSSTKGFKTPIKLRYDGCIQKIHFGKS